MILPVWVKPVAALAVIAGAYTVGHWHGSDNVQAEWDAENARVATALTAALIETEQFRKSYIDQKKESESKVAALESAVAAGAKRLRVKATCVPDTTAVPGRAGSGTAELDAAARQDYYALRRGLDEQRALLNICRAALKSRSKDP